MKVKVAELKAKLSEHLRYVRKTGQRIEVYARETPVAYLTATDRESSEQAAAAERERSARLAGAGLLVTQVPSGGRRPELPERPPRAGDGRVDVDTMAAMRKERDG